MQKQNKTKQKNKTKKQSPLFCKIEKEIYWKGGHIKRRAKESETRCHEM